MSLPCRECISLAICKAQFRGYHPLIDNCETLHRYAYPTFTHKETKISIIKMDIDRKVEITNFFSSTGGS